MRFRMTFAKFWVPRHIFRICYSGIQKYSLEQKICRSGNPQQLSEPEISPDQADQENLVYE